MRARGRLDGVADALLHGEAWDAMGASADLVRHQWRQLLPGLLLLWLITLISAAFGWWLLGLWLPLAAFLLQDFYCSAKG